MGKFDYRRRESKEVHIGEYVKIGSTNKVMIQTMANVDTNDIDAGVEQAKKCIESGAELVRFTTQGIKEVESLAIISQKLRNEGINTPLSADIHFNSNVAERAALTVEKIRINPGNFVSGKRGEYSNDEWEEERTKIREKLKPIIRNCKEKGTAIRIGVNHGSMSPRMMSKYGDTPRGLAESCIEMIEMIEKMNFNNIVLSIKASNARIMVQTVRLLASMIDARGMNYPIHLGVTEAGSDDEGRIKSAIGIGALLMDGIGDTIRVSLSENPEDEIPVADKLVRYVRHRGTDVKIQCENDMPFNPFEYSRRKSNKAEALGDGQVPVVIAHSDGLGADYTVLTMPRFLMLGSLKDIDEMTINALAHNPNVPLMLAPANPNFVGEIRAMVSEFDKAGIRNPIVASRVYMTDDIEELEVMAGADFGALLIDGLLDGIYIYDRSEVITEQQVVDMQFKMLQASRARITDTEYITCPGCGRTKYDLNAAVKKVKEATKGYKGMKIAIMGCVVNGPGEMADADFGYVGGAAGRVSLYKGRECIVKNISEDEAVDELVKIIKNNK